MSEGSLLSCAPTVPASPTPPMQAAMQGGEQHGARKGAEGAPTDEQPSPLTAE